MAGAWRNFTVKIAEQADLPRICRHFRAFYYKEELFNKLLGTSENYLRDQDALCKWALDQSENLSFLALTPQNEIAATLIAVRETVDLNIAHQFPFDSKEMGVLLKSFEIMEKQIKLTERYKVNTWVNGYIGSVATEYRQQGLITELLKRSLTVSCQKGYPLWVICATNQFTLKLCRSLNFEEICCVSLKDLHEKSEDGHVTGGGGGGGRIQNNFQLFPTATDKDVVSVMCLKLP